MIFGYNGRDGVVTDKNGLIYMRARYYSPDMKRFVNADIVAGEISNAVTLNRFAYANGNPVSFIDPFGLRAMSMASHAMTRDGGGGGYSGPNQISFLDDDYVDPYTAYVMEIIANSNSQPQTGITAPSTQSPSNNIKSIIDARVHCMSKQASPDEIPPEYSWEPSIHAPSHNNYDSEQDLCILEQILIKGQEELCSQMFDTGIDLFGQYVDKYAEFGKLIIPDKTPPSVYINAAFKAFSATQTAYSFYDIVRDNCMAGSPWQETVSDVGIEVVGLGWGTAWTVIGTSFGTTIAPGPGTVAGAILGTIFGALAEIVYEIQMAPSFDDYYRFD